jgi:hypothetical protein
MNQEQNIQSEAHQMLNRHGYVRAQMRQERRLAKQSERAERRMARAQRPHRNWSFEIHVGEKVYTFTWRWQEAEFHSQVESATATTDREAEIGLSEPEAGQ